MVLPNLQWLTNIWVHCNVRDAVDSKVTPATVKPVKPLNPNLCQRPKGKIDLWPFDLCEYQCKMIGKPRWTFNCVIYTFTKSKLFSPFLDIRLGHQEAPEFWVPSPWQNNNFGGSERIPSSDFFVRPAPPPQKPPCKTVELPGFRALSMSLSACQKKLETVGQTKTFLQTLIYQTKECNMSNSVLVQQIYPAIQYFPLSPSQTWSTVASSSGHPGTSLLDGVRRD